MTFAKSSILFAAALMCASTGAVAQTPIAKSGVTLQNRQATVPATLKLWHRSFDDVTKAVSVMCFDEEVCGKKWDDLTARYKPLVPFLKNEEELHILLQRMLNELNTSHFRIIPKTFENRKEAEPWGIGVDLAIVDSRMLVKKVHPGSPAERANLRPGFVITKIDDRDVDQLIGKYKSNPLWGGNNWKITLGALIHSFYLNGPQDTPVHIQYLNETDVPQQAQLERGFRHQPHKTVEHKVLEGGVGYIKLGIFDATKMPEFCAAVRSLNDAPAIILDLRDNPGGITGMIEAITGLLSSKPVKLGRMFKKDASSWDPFAENALESYPQAKAFEGRLVVLINQASGSSSEILAAGLRESGRAIVVGERSMGEVMPSTVAPLPTAAFLQVAVSDYETASGVRLEGKGVTPDITVSNSRNGMLANTDEQLRAAADLIKKGDVFNSLKPIEGKPMSQADLTGKNEAPEDEASTATVIEDLAGDILDNYTSAVGGRAAIDKLNSRVVSGTVKNSITGASGKFTIYDMKPDKYMMVIRYDNGTVEQTAINGPDVWTFTSQYGFRKYDNMQVSKRDLTFTPFPSLDPALSMKRRYRRIYYLKEEISADKRPAHLIGTAKDGDENLVSDYFSFDKKTGLLVKAGFQYSDYRVIDGVRVPFSVKVEGMISYTVEQVSHNIEIPKETFEKPVESCFTTPGQGC